MGKWVIVIPMTEDRDAKVAALMADMAVNDMIEKKIPEWKGELQDHFTLGVPLQDPFLKELFSDQVLIDKPQEAGL